MLKWPKGVVCWGETKGTWYGRALASQAIVGIPRTSLCIYPAWVGQNTQNLHNVEIQYQFLKMQGKQYIIHLGSIWDI